MPEGEFQLQYPLRQHLLSGSTAQWKLWGALAGQVQKRYTREACGRHSYKMVAFSLEMGTLTSSRVSSTSSPTTALLIKILMVTVTIRFIYTDSKKKPSVGITKPAPS